MSAGRGNASCYADLLRQDAPYAAQIDRDPKAAIASLQSAIDAPPGQSVNADPSRAHLYVMLADALESAGDIVAASIAVDSGKKALLAADGTMLRRRLQITGDLLLEEQGHLDRALADPDLALVDTLEAAPDLPCLLIYRGALRFRAGKNVDASADLIRASGMARDLGRIEVRLLAGGILSRVYTKTGLYAEARELADEAIAFYARSGSQLRLADAYFLRGDVFQADENFVLAEADYLQARSILLSAKLPLELVFAQQALCITASRIPNRADALGICREAYDMTKATQDPEGLKMILGAFGEIAFRHHHPIEAIHYWNQALADDGVDFPSMQRWRAHRLRAQALTRVGDLAGALRDTEFCLGSLESDQVARVAQQLALLRVRFETSLKDEELARSRAETQSAELRMSKQAFLRNSVVAAAVLVVSTVVFGSWAFHRRRLAMDAEATAEERLAALGRLTGGIAHDFNNLLAVLKQALWLLGRRESIQADQAAVELLQQAGQSTSTCAEITSQLLSFARQQNLRPEAVGLRPFLTELLPLLEKAVGPSIALQLDICSPEAVVWVDSRQLAAALLNLVTNARDAITANGTVTASGTITIMASTQPRNRVRIDVIDHGCGMGPKVLARAIEPFFTTKPVGHGSGLGLSMVDGFATQSGGTLSITSEPNQGTTVSLWLPAVAKDASV
jgi:signal transduction histidine kinase